MTDPRKAEQLSLGLPSDVAMTRGDFLIAPSNALALAAIEAPGGLPAGTLVLIGPEGSGKTHLARIWAAQVGAQWQTIADLGADMPGLLAEGGPLAVVLDGAEALAGGVGEEALFHLLNHLRGRGQVLLTARVPVRDWGLALPDLVSRLTAATSVTLAEPDEALLAAVLVKLFNDRQVRVQPALIAYLTSRMERSLAAAGAIVAALDARALRLGRPITRALAQEVLTKELLAQRELALDLDNEGSGGAS